MARSLPPGAGLFRERREETAQGCRGWDCDVQERTGVNSDGPETMQASQPLQGQRGPRRPAELHRSLLGPE